MRGQKASLQAYTCVCVRRWIFRYLCVYVCIDRHTVCTRQCATQFANRPVGYLPFTRFTQRAREVTERLLMIRQRRGLCRQYSDR